VRSRRLIKSAGSRHLPASRGTRCVTQPFGRIVGQCVGLLTNGLSQPQARPPHLFEQPDRLHDAIKADQGRNWASSDTRQEHLYDGLLTVLLRLVFLLYAEDRDLIPSRTDAAARVFYDQGYGVRPLYSRLLDDKAHYPDTMDERRGAWSRLLALFRLVHQGDSTGDWIRGRGGKLFDTAEFPFLQGQERASDPPSPAAVSDGCILRVLDLLLNLGGEKLSYRTLDVEQIGSVYETVMGFTIETRSGPALAIRAGKNDRTPVFVDIAALAAEKGPDRTKFLKEKAGRNALSDKVSKALSAATSATAVVEALRPIVDERGSPGGAPYPPGSPLLQPTDERRRTGSHYTPRSLTAPMVERALEPAYEQLGPDARPEEVLDLKVCRRGDHGAPAGDVAGDRFDGTVSTHARGRPAQEATAGPEAVRTARCDSCADDRSRLPPGRVADHLRDIFGGVCRHHDGQGDLRSAAERL
jgi:hypothetical protein